MKVFSDQVSKFLIVGIALNLLAFISFTISTESGGDPIVTFSIIYPVLLILNFKLNNDWTFESKRIKATNFGRFLAVHVIGYFCNLAILHVLVDLIGIRPYIAMTLLILGMTGYYYLAMKVFVFKG